MTRQDRSPPQPVWQGETYHGQPALKHPHWDWKVSGYISIAGIIGAAQALATLGALRDPEAMRGARRGAGLLAVAGSVAGAVLLIADLKTPQRFHNMLRILRPTSPMSFGTYVFSAFGGASALAALGELPAAQRLRPLRLLAGIGQALAALSGAGVATYAASLLSATSNPLWAAAPRALGAQLASAAVASGAAALALWERLAGRDGTARRFEAVAATATVAQVAAGAAIDGARAASGVDAALADSASRQTLTVASLVVAGVLPLAGYALALGGGRAGRGAALAGSVAVLAGGMLMRHALLDAGKEAVARPEAGFAFAQPGRRHG